jgi:ATP-binding cassette subfamily C protein EexD
MLSDQRLQQLVDNIRSAVFSVGVFSLVSSVLMLVIPLFTLQVLDRVLSTRSIDSLIMLTIGAVLVLIIMGVLHQVRERIMARVAMQVDEQLGPMIFRLLLQQAAFTGIPENARLIREVHQLRNFLSGSSLFVLFELVWFPVFVVIVYVFSPILGGVVTAAALLILLFGALGELVARPLMLQAEDNYSNSVSSEDIFLRNAETIEAMGMSSHIEQLWHQQQGMGLTADLRSSDTIATLNALTRFTRTVLNIMLMSVGGWLVINEQITTGVMIASLIIGIRAIAPLEGLMISWRSFNLSRATYDRLKNRLLATETPRLNHAITSIPRGGLTVDNLVYVPHGSRKPVLKGISFHLPDGVVMGITGPNGAGKSTLLKIAMGLHAPTGGTVHLGDLEVSQLNRELFGYHIGYLKQDAELFPGTVADNISRLQPAPVDDVIAAAQFAGAHKMITSLPDGYGTKVIDGGVNLSSGQRQMIALARAVFGEPRFVVLDEPSAMLDLNETAAVGAMLKRLRHAKITTLLVTHQSRLLKQVNHVMVLKEGMIESMNKASPE